MEAHEARIAKALNLSRAQRIVDYTHPNPLISRPPLKQDLHGAGTRAVWDGSQWALEGSIPKTRKSQEVRTLPTAPFKVLDAPNLRDDFYCSVLAYCATAHTLAVGLGTMLYAWSEKQGVQLLHAGVTNGPWLTSIAFSSTQGQRCILAYGRSDGTLTMMSLYDRPLPRFQLQQPCPIACVSWRPTETVRRSVNPNTPGELAKCEDLIVGDESGVIYYYSVEWPTVYEVNQSGWSGAISLIARICIHSQQICGLAWSPDGTLLATGGNDNLCCLFEVNRILPVQNENNDFLTEAWEGNDGMRKVQGVVTGEGVKQILAGQEKHHWLHRAAVKAIAFCPWRSGLLATGGGSNDKCIHFFHAFSGSCLATISVAAQVTSLIWSTTRREIAATFGYAQPEHPIRVAVFSWPDCTQVAAIPWEGEHRALYAISYPGGPNESHKGREGGSTSKPAAEGCIVVAASDESVKFHEVWSSGHKATSGGAGLLGGSDILESLEGIDRDGEIIR